MLYPFCSHLMVLPLHKMNVPHHNPSLVAIGNLVALIAKLMWLAGGGHETGQNLLSQTFIDSLMQLSHDREYSGA